MDTFQSSNICEKVLGRADYLQIICSFLRIGEIIRSLSSVSKFHITFLNDIQQAKLIETAVNREFDDLLQLLDIQLRFRTLENQDTIVEDDESDNSDDSSDESSSDESSSEDDSKNNNYKSRNSRKKWKNCYATGQLSLLFSIDKWGDLISMILNSPITDKSIDIVLNHDEKNKSNQNCYRINFLLAAGNCSMVKYWLPKVKPIVFCMFVFNCCMTA